MAAAAEDFGAQNTSELAAELGSRLGRRLRREPVWTAGPTTRSVHHDRAAIERLLQHRAPFLLLDRITAIDPVQGAVEARRTLDPADPVFAGHFPGEPVYPGALQIEMIGQLCLLSHHFHAVATYDIPLDATPRRYRGVQVHHAAFLGELLPGAEVTVRAKLLDSDSLAMTCAGQLLLGERICAVAVMEAYFVD